MARSCCCHLLRLFRWRAPGFLALALFISGCGNNPHPKPWREKRADGSPWVVRYAAIPEEIRSLDPQVMYDQVSRMVIEPVMDTLLEYHPMKTDPYEVAPCLLEALPQRVDNSDGGVTYICRLRKNVFFHDDACFPEGKGREVKAGDVHYAFQRLCDPKLRSPFFGNFAEYIAGVSEAFEEAKKAGEQFDYDRIKVRGVEVIDSHTFKLHLLKPYPQILYWLALPCATPVAREAIEYYDGKAHPAGSNGAVTMRPLAKFHPVGHGAFQLVEWVRGQRFRFVRNERYRTVTFPDGGWPAEREPINRPLAGKPLPLVDEVQLTVFRELLPIWLLTRQGYLDRMGVMKDAANSAITSSKELTPRYARRGMKLEHIQEVSTFWLSINMQDPVLGPNKKLRQAISCAYDPQGYSDMLYGGAAPVAQQLIPPGIFGHDKTFRNPYGSNIEKARRLIAEAGYPNGIDPKTGRPLEVTLDVAASGAEERQLAEYEQRQLEQLGIRVRIIENTFARLLDKEKDGDYQISTTGWGADYPDAENFFFLFTRRSFPPEGSNYCRYENAEFETLFSRMATMENTPERMAIIRRMSDILIEDCPALMTFHKGYYVIAQPWAPVTHKNTLLEGGLKYLPIDHALRDKQQRQLNEVPAWPLVLAGAVFAMGVVYTVSLSRKRNV